MKQSFKKGLRKEGQSGGAANGSEAGKYLGTSARVSRQPWGPRTVMAQLGMVDQSSSSSQHARKKQGRNVPRSGVHLGGFNREG